MKQMRGGNGLRFVKFTYIKTIICRYDINCDFFWQGCLGALDGTYIKVRVPTDDRKPYRTRKGEICTNVLGVCTRDLMFTYVLAGWEGSAADSRVLRDAISRPKGLKITHGILYRTFKYLYINILKRTHSYCSYMFGINRIILSL